MRRQRLKRSRTSMLLHTTDLGRWRAVQPSGSLDLPRGVIVLLRLSKKKLPLHGASIECMIFIIIITLDFGILVIRVKLIAFEFLERMMFHRPEGQSTIQEHPAASTDACTE